MIFGTDTAMLPMHVNQHIEAFNQSNNMYKSRALVHLFFFNPVCNNKDLYQTQDSF